MSFFEAAPGRARAIKKFFFAGFAFFTSKWNYCRVTGPQNKIFIKNQLTLVQGRQRVDVHLLFNRLAVSLLPSHPPPSSVSLWLRHKHRHFPKVSIRYSSTSRLWCPREPPPEYRIATASVRWSRQRRAGATYYVL
jgi:hypothetical protein